MRFLLTDTIAALATPYGKGAISLIRVSGDKSYEIAGTIFKPRSKKAIQFFYPHVGEIVSPQNRFIDHAVLIAYQKPKSYTGEDMLEISCHGSPIITAEVLEVLLAAGARLAEPGEFSCRAFINGKMDLVQAESVPQLIEAQTRRQAQMAGAQLNGEISRYLSGIKEKLIQMIVHLETAVEFVEVDWGEIQLAEHYATLQQISMELDHLAKSYETGDAVCQGRKVAILGRPNVGKSSLFNKLIKEERAIVCEIAGTTRDALHGSIELNGMPLQVMDTAGWRKARNKIEAEGVRRSQQALEEADLVLLVLDAKSGWHLAETEILNRVKKDKKLLLVWNKMDLVTDPLKQDVKQISGLQVCHLSAKTGIGVEECKRAIGAILMPETAAEDELIITNIRQKHEIDGALGYLLLAQEAMEKNYSEEYVISDLKKALECIGEITGETTKEDILEMIFSRFCIGK